MSSSASRTTTGTNSLHLKLEAQIAAFMGTEDAVVLSSGYLSMRCLLEAICLPGDLILADEGVHPSIQEAIQLTKLPVRIFNSRNIASFSHCIRREGSQEGRFLIVAEGIGPLTGKVFPLRRIYEQLAEVDALILLDDAHGFGVVGPQGRGTAEMHDLHTDLRVLSCATLSKAFGSLGGCISGTRTLTEAIRGRALPYICSSSPSGADLGASLAALRRLSREPRILSHLRSNVRRLKKGLRRLSIDVADNDVPIVPLFLGEAGTMRRISRKLFDLGVIAPYIDYPGSPENGIIRLAISASHTEGDIDRLLDVLEGVSECKPTQP